jgi:gamma-glutamyl:cysteine ligase YbdK (ATP-grasp superfamily)
MLADTPDVDGLARKAGFQPGILSDEDVLAGGSAGHPVRRMGLEQEFFLVDRNGAPRDLADLFLGECREAARAEGVDPQCFEAESVNGLVEITTPPSFGVVEMTRHYLRNLDLALGVAAELGLALYPLGTYPLRISPTIRDDPGYGLKASILGHRRFLHAGRCAGAHLHLELPAGTVWPDVKASLDATVDAQRELLGVYNLATALDPALVALTRACPFYQGEMVGFVAARIVHYRGILGFDGLYANLREVGGLSAYAGRAEDLIDQQRVRYRAWFAAMDRAGVERRLFASAGGNLHRASWNPVRLSRHGTVEIRTMDANFPEMVLAVCALIQGAAERVRRERLEVRPGRGVLTLEAEGDLLRVPTFSHLNGELLRAAVTGGLLDRRVEAYVDSLVRFASPYLERPELVEPLGTSGSYTNTEREILASFPHWGASLSRDQGLSMVREACSRMDEQVSSLRRRYDGAPQGDQQGPGVARVVFIRESPIILAEGLQPAGEEEGRETAKEADKEFA